MTAEGKILTNYKSFYNRTYPSIVKNKIQLIFLLFWFGLTINFHQTRGKCEKMEDFKNDDKTIEPTKKTTRMKTKYLMIKV